MSEQENNLDDLLDGEPATDASQPEQAPQPEMDAGPEPGTPEIETGDNDDAPPASDHQDDGPVVPRRALEDERRKRQENEQRVQQMEAWIAQQQQAMQQPQQPEPEIDWWTDPEAAAKHQAQQFNQTLQQQIAQQNQMLAQTRIEMSEQMLRSQHEDYDDTIKVFEDAVRAMPPQQGEMLVQQMLQNPMPAQFAYQTAKQMQMMQDVGSDPTGYREKLKAEIMAELGMTDGEAPAQVQNTRPNPPQVPRSLAGKTNSRPRNSSGQFVEHASFEELLDE